MAHSNNLSVELTTKNGNVKQEIFETENYEQDYIVEAQVYRNEEQTPITDPIFKCEAVYIKNEIIIEDFDLKKESNNEALLMKNDNECENKNEMFFKSVKVEENAEKTINDEFIIKNDESDTNDGIFQCESCYLTFDTEIQLNDHTFWCKTNSGLDGAVNQIQNGCESADINSTHTDSDENYVPGNKNSENSNEASSVEIAENAVTPQKGKKRICRKSLWKRNIRKSKRTKGDSYESTSGVIVNKKQREINCNCKLNCLNKIGYEGCKKIFDDFYDIPSKDQQDAYLFGLLRSKSVERHRPRSGNGRRRNFSYVYKILDAAKERYICKVAFLKIHAITKSRLERLQKHLSDSNNSTPPLDRRGKHFSRPNKIPDDIIEKIQEHILSYPRYKSHYCRKDNIQHYYISPLLNISKMYEMYIEKNEPEQYQLILKNEKTNPIVKYDFFRKCFIENFKITFGSRKSDTCSKCDELRKSFRR